MKIRYEDGDGLEKPTRVRREAERPTVRQRIAKPVRLRSFEYLRFIHTKPCFVCGNVYVEAAHISDGNKALGSKPSDFRVLPACAYHHRLSPYSLDVCSRKSFEQTWRKDLEAEINKLLIEWLETQI